MDLKTVVFGFADGVRRMRIGVVIMSVPGVLIRRIRGPVTIWLTSVLRVHEYKEERGKQAQDADPGNRWGQTRLSLCCGRGPKTIG
jgi:hypothetical protein